MTRLGTLSTVRTLPLLFAVAIVNTAHPQGRQFTPGEVMVRFVAGSDPSDAVAAALRADPEEPRALTPAVIALSAMVGVPLRATRVASGDWVLLSIDSLALTERIQGQLGSREGVERVTRRDGAPRLLVTFAAGSAEAQAVRQKRRDASAEPMDRLVCTLEREVGLPLAVEAVSDRGLALDIDVRTLTQSLPSRLQAVPDVAAAQLNYVVRHMRE